MNTHPLLRGAMQVNAAFSALSGLVLAWFSHALSALVFAAPLPNGPLFLTITGLLLLPFSGYVFLTSRGVQIVARAALAIVVSDLAWVVVSFMLLLIDGSTFTIVGKWMIAAIAAVVGALAAFQYLGLRQAQTS